MAEHGPHFTGLCVGGPLRAKHITVRFPRGFLLVDKQNSKAWVYDYDADAQVFDCRDDAGRNLDHVKRFDAVDSADWDVVAHAG